MGSPYTGEGEKIAQTRGEFVQNMNEVGGVTAFGEKSIELIHGSISFLIYIIPDRPENISRNHGRTVNNL